MINLMGGDKAFIRRLDNLFGSSLDPRTMLIQKM